MTFIAIFLGIIIVLVLGAWWQSFKRTRRLLRRLREFERRRDQ